jgi:transcriptional regulator GlxA family with amidase domain
MVPDQTTTLVFGNLPRLAANHAGIANCLHFMATNCLHPIKLKDLETVAGLSRRGFQKAFRKHAGLSPGQVLRHLRIEHAKRLLVESDMKLDAIAIRCGYRKANTFCIAFRQVMGMPPKQFQRQALAGHLSPRSAG